jgi:hypothetical protein
VSDIEFKEEFEAFGKIHSLRCNQRGPSFVAYFKEEDA